MTATQPALYALLVGIDNYAHPRVPDLGGCVNDVNAMEQLLRDKFKVPAENILKLTDQQATHQAIKKAFRTHLIARADGWVEAGKPDPAPAFLFHYSGHGSQALDETQQEPDGLDETLVPHDSRVGDVYDIKDWELGELIDALAAPFTEENANVTIIMDCCHSGSGTRDTSNPSLIPTRRCEPDMRPQPNQRPTRGGGQTRSVSGSSGWELGTKYVLLAGCRDREEANEHIPSQGAAGLNQQGAMTYFLLQELNRMSPDRPLTYRDLHERIRYQVNSRYEQQMPQCEGQKDRYLFGGLLPEREVMFSVVDLTGMVWIDGGIAHGLTEGSQLHVYPPGTHKVSEADRPIATLYVEEVSAVKSGCLVEEGNLDDIQIASRVKLVHLELGQMQQQVVLDIADAGLRAGIQARLGQDDVRSYIQLVPREQPANLRIQQVGDNLELQDATGKPLVAAFPPDKRDELPRDLLHIVRYYNTLKLANGAGYSELADTMQIEIKQLVIEGATVTTAPLERNDEGEVEIEVGQRIVVEVTNKASQPLYVAVFNFAHDWAINLLYPRMQGANEALEPGRSIQLGLSPKKREQLTPILPKGINEVREFIKVIATVEDTDFGILQMSALKTPDQTRSAPTGQRSALTALLEQAAEGGGTRALGAPPSTVEDEWTTAELQFRLIRPVTDAEISQPLRGGVPARLSGFELELEPPEGFQGEVRVLTARQNTRAAGELAELEPPPGLAPFKAAFEPVEIRPKGTRDALGTGGAIIEITTDDASRRAVTSETPLKLRLPVETRGAEEAMLALAYDGSFFYPVGRPGDEAHTINVEWLPEAPAPEAEAVRTRNLGRTLKLYLFKMADWPEPSLGLHKARFVPPGEINEDQPEADERSYEADGGEARYRDLRPNELQAGQRVALFVHGFTSETKWMVGRVLPWLEENGVSYDHYLTFDYETFNTHVSDNGQILAKALRAASFGPDDGIHLDVFAHSMGTMVARSMIEQHGGDSFVDRAFLAGPPNKGSRLAEAKKLVPWVGTVLLNQAGPTPPTLIASWALKKITDDAVGGDDLRPSADFIQRLNAIDQEAKVPYYILAGRNVLTPAEGSAWDRLARTLMGAADAGLDLLFGDQHDLIINVQSMLTVRNGDYPVNLLHKHVLPCNHFQYFGSREGQAKLLEWLKG